MLFTKYGPLHIFLCDLGEFVKLLCGSVKEQHINIVLCIKVLMGSSLLLIIGSNRLNVIFILCVDLAPVQRGQYEILWEVLYIVSIYM